MLHSVLSWNAVQYTVQHLAKVAFPDMKAEVEVAHKEAVIHVESFHVHLPMLSQEEVGKLQTGRMEYGSLLSKSGHHVPFFRVRPSEGNGLEKQGEDLFCAYDLVTLPFLLMSRKEEDLPGASRDEHGRFLFSGSLSDRYGLVDFPLADEYALWLRHEVCAAFPQWEVCPRPPRCVSTHDVDLLFRFGGWYKSMHTLAADMLKYRSCSLFRQSFRQWRVSHQDPAMDPYVLACGELLRQDMARGRQSIFFFKSLCAGETDVTYDITSELCGGIVRHLHSEGAEIALHGSIRSAGDGQQLSEERSRLEAAAGREITTNRQHYLCFTPRETLAAWQVAGLSDDYTLGFAEREGFRCGTCHPYPLYDWEKDAPTEVIEHPLIAMDTTFFRYRHVSREEALRRLRELKQTCETVEGDFILLWHNSTFWREYAPWYKEVFCEL
ncbi:MAG: polysaccharide deacetylase family protein [Bacteroidales bacterium]|nr:polysaccharide deacetylase family protein [Bacteroidales bacterium]